MTKYDEAFKNGFNAFGMNGFYDMHKEICSGEASLWEDDMKVLNELDISGFELLADEYLKHIK